MRPPGSRVHRGLTGARELVGRPYLADPELRREYDGRDRAAHRGRRCGRFWRRRRSRRRAGCWTWARALAPWARSCARAGPRPSWSPSTEWPAPGSCAPTSRARFGPRAWRGDSIWSSPRTCSTSCALDVDGRARLVAGWCRELLEPAGDLHPGRAGAARDLARPAGRARPLARSRACSWWRPACCRALVPALVARARLLPRQRRRHRGRAAPASTSATWCCAQAGQCRRRRRALPHRQRSDEGQGPPALLRLRPGRPACWSRASTAIARPTTRRSTRSSAAPWSASRARSSSPTVFAAAGDGGRAPHRAGVPTSPHSVRRRTPRPRRPTSRRSSRPGTSTCSGVSLSMRMPCVPSLMRASSWSCAAGSS